MKETIADGCTCPGHRRLRAQQRDSQPMRIHLPPAVFAASAQLYALKYKHSDIDISAWAGNFNDQGWKFLVPGAMAGTYTLDGPVYFNRDELENVIGMAEAYYAGVIDESA